MAIPIPDVSLIDNSDERAPLVLVLDCSGSMDGEPMRQLNSGLKALAEAMRNDPVTATRGRILTISFGGNDDVEIGSWQDALDWTAPLMSASGRTPTGAAVAAALDAIEAQKAELRAAGVSYKRPILLLMSDGVPTDDWEGVAESCRNAEQAKKVNVITIAVGPDADKGCLDRFNAKGAFKLDGLKFNDLFVWLSQSVRAVSQAAIGEVVQIPAPTAWIMGTDSN
jgi:uncharacterized protein YegL